MNKAYATLILTTIVLNCSTTQAAIGCMQKSLNLQEKYDPKVFHFVECNCPCVKYMSQCSRPMPHDQCPKCRHLHVPQSQIVVTEAVRLAAMQKVKRTSPVAFENAEKALTSLLARSRQ